MGVNENRSKYSQNSVSVDTDSYRLMQAHAGSLGTVNPRGAADTSLGTVNADSITSLLMSQEQQTSKVTCAALPCIYIHTEQIHLYV